MCKCPLKWNPMWTQIHQGLVYVHSSCNSSCFIFVFYHQHPVLTIEDWQTNAMVISVIKLLFLKLVQIEIQLFTSCTLYRHIQRKFVLKDCFLRIKMPNVPLQVPTNDIWSIHNNKSLYFKVNLVKRYNE